MPRSTRRHRRARCGGDASLSAGPGRLRRKVGPSGSVWYDTADRRRAMAEINVSTSMENDSYEFEVTVSEGGSETRHQVTLTKADHERLTGGQATPEELVRESFRFLLERESKESILRSFDLAVISDYFPAYERVIKKRL